MKTFLNRLLVLLYIITSMGILMIAMAYPFALAFDDHPPYWICWILYPITLIIMTSQSQMLKWADNIMECENS